MANIDNSATSVRIGALVRATCPDSYMILAVTFLVGGDKGGECRECGADDRRQQRDPDQFLFHLFWFNDYK